MSLMTWQSSALSFYWLVYTITLRKLLISLFLLNLRYVNLPFPLLWGSGMAWEGETGLEGVSSLSLHCLCSENSKSLSSRHFSGRKNNFSLPFESVILWGRLPDAPNRCTIPGSWNAKNPEAWTLTLPHDLFWWVAICIQSHVQRDSPFPSLLITFLSHLP